ncbi:peptidoglycan DD-metalloendopeptidase family protein [Arenimonas oryziterrae]|uniref:LysM domain-containing protein n=1 Tax=Arenimonas oryziterrae DSM 21050 = YC6267 TaxID=1121015 RepID=A0A091AZD0_9GAMM|nr:hypothetical protein N789_01980 [Arenimonas oryziterrae DSM 21050 = YC6267]
MPHKTTHLLTLLLMAMTLSACTSARVVRQYYPDQDAPPPRTSRPAPISEDGPPPRPEVQPIPRDETYIVKPGETLYGISTRFGLKFKDVAAWNRIGEPFAIQSGQRLHLRPPEGELLPEPVVTAPVATPPVATPPKPATPVVTTPPKPAPATTPSVPVPTPPVVTAPVPVPTPPVVPVPSPGTTTAPPTSADPPPVVIAGAPKWRWPTQGQIIGRYVAGDQTQQGINIAGKSGQTVYASADGVVVYSGAGLVGYGELIIIKHSDEWLSAYAHNRRRLVAEGTKVKAGDAIAEMGRTGAVRDMLHFEIRRNGKPVDPLQFLPKP